MNELVAIIMFGWVPLVLVLFALLPARRAAVISLVGGWLFLPVAAFKLQGIPAYDKAAATCLGALLATLLFDFGRFTRLRWKWLDLPMLIWCVCPIFSSLSNELGWYDGFSASLRQTVTWGLPYLVGRLYFADLAGIKELAVGIVVGGLLYVPLCLYEVRMSPQLHRIAYGFTQQAFEQSKRFGGWRPTVFMQHGLAVGMWMAAASLLGLWMWRSGAMKTLYGAAAHWWVLALVVTAVLCKSAGALGLMAVGVGLLMVARHPAARMALLMVILAVPGYVGSRLTGASSGDIVVSLADAVAGPDRAQSLEFRLHNEDQLAEKALERPVLGWGGWGRARVYDDSGRDVSVTDGLWIIALGWYGFVGLGALTTVLILPALLVVRRWPPGTWMHPARAPAVALAVVLALYALDCLLNAMINPVFTAAIGGLVGAIEVVRPARSRQGSTPRWNQQGPGQRVRVWRRRRRMVASQPVADAASVQQVPPAVETGPS